MKLCRLVPAAAAVLLLGACTGNPPRAGASLAARLLANGQGERLLVEHGGLWIVLFLVLLPIAMTMALVWKTKEVIMSSVFGPGA